jgi:hypothetical protein
MTLVKSIPFILATTTAFVVFSQAFLVAQETPETKLAIYQAADPVEIAAQATLDKHCSRCHQVGRLENLKKPVRGFGDVLQLDKLVLNPNLILPGNPEGSRLFQQVVNRNMPYDVYMEGADKPSVSDADILTLRTWIEAAGKRQADACKMPKAYAANDIIEVIFRDLSKLPEQQRATTRYVTISHLAAACSTDSEIEVYRQGVVKLLNSLSSESDVYALRAADDERLVIRFNLEDLNWTPELWEHIVSLYPYGVVPANSDFEAVAERTNTQVPYVRGDWLAFFASRPPLYEKILNLPSTFQALEKQLGVDTLGNITRNETKRAGFKESGVSQNNRLIERHTISTGAFWTSYDFGGTKDRQNLLEFPLGPAEAFSQTNYGDKFAFVHDGGESIFNLPNGFQAYYLNNAKGEYLDKGPTNIVRDPDRTDLAVTNGISCMGCHDQGMKNATDEVRAHVRNTQVLPLLARKTVDALYPEKAEFDRLLAKDRDRFIAAVKLAGLDPQLKNGNEEVINALSNRYERDVDLKTAAAEFGVTVETVSKYLQSASSIGASFASQLELGTVQRDIFEAEFGGLVENVMDATSIQPSPNTPRYNDLKEKEVITVATSEAFSNELTVSVTANDATAKPGDKPVFTVRASRDCSLTLVNVDSNGVGTVMFPNKFAPNNRIKGGRDFVFPAVDAKFDFKFLDIGTETIIAICDEGGASTIGITHDYEQSAFTDLGTGLDLSRKIDTVKRPAKKGSAKQVKYSGVARAAIKIKVQ